MADTYERKEIKLRELKLAPPAEATGEFSGYLAAYGNIDRGMDILEPGCFADYLAEMKAADDWPALLLNHGGMDWSADDMLPIGIYLDLAEDDYGLKFSAKLCDTERGTDVYKLMKMQPRPAIKGKSIGWRATEYSFEPHPTIENCTVRRVRKGILGEGSVVTFPMNKRATITDVKSAGGSYDARKLESALRDVCGLSQAEAKRLMSGGFAALSQRDAGGEMGELAALLRKNTSILTART